MQIILTEVDTIGAKSIFGVPMKTWEKVIGEFRQSPDRELIVTLLARTIWKKAT